LAPLALASLASPSALVKGSVNRLAVAGLFSLTPALRFGVR
jgi:hypothetical protein